MSDDSTRDSAAGRDPEIERTEEAKSSAASLFDIRRIIGGLFTLYGVLVLGAGLFDGSNAKEKASGIDINIWTGLGMLLLGLGMLAWMALRPVDVRAVQHEMDESDGRSAGTAES
jgi:hypothetical protein